MFKFIAALFVVCMSAAPSVGAERCDNCMMKVADDSPYRVTVKFSDADTKQVCSIYCASMEVERAKDPDAVIAVVDYLSGEEIDAKDAVWVEGSDVRPMMSDESRIAFRDAAAAEAFVAEHGGRVTGFDEVYENSVNEWKGR